MPLNADIEKYVLGSLLSDDLPRVALEALEAGYDSPSLRQVAGASGADPRDINDLFIRALTELRIQMPSPADAALSLARQIAGEVVQGTISPYEGARRIWFDVYVRFPELTRLRPFVGLASEYEDDELHREKYSATIMEECRHFLSE